MNVNVLRLLLFCIFAVLACAKSTAAEYAGSDLSLTLGIAIGVPLGSCWYVARNNGIL